MHKGRHHQHAYTQPALSLLQHTAITSTLQQQQQQAACDFCEYQWHMPVLTTPKCLLRIANAAVAATAAHMYHPCSTRRVFKMYTNTAHLQDVESTMQRCLDRLTRPTKHKTQQQNTCTLRYCSRHNRPMQAD
jgi:hypothetical protein